VPLKCQFTDNKLIPCIIFHTYITCLLVAISLIVKPTTLIHISKHCFCIPDEVIYHDKNLFPKNDKIKNIQKFE
jgi:hypothetical protein